MSAHVKVWRGLGRYWFSECVKPTCLGAVYPPPLLPTHAEALAAAWAHIKEHS